MSKMRRKMWHHWDCDTCHYNVGPLPECESGTGRCTAPRKGTHIEDMAILGPEKTNRRCSDYLWQHDESVSGCRQVKRGRYHEVDAMVYSRTPGGTFTMYGGTTQAMFVEQAFGDKAQGAMEQMRQGELVADPGGTVWFMALPVKGKTPHERIVAALTKYGILSIGPLSRVSSSSAYMIRKLAKTSDRFCIAANKRGSTGMYPVYGLIKQTSETEEGGEEKWRQTGLF